MSAPPRRKRRFRAVIALTPLIDVVFILLVFFMLASSFLDWRSIPLGSAQAGGFGGAEGALLVEARAGDYRLSGEALDAAALSARIASRIEAEPETRILLRAAPGVDVGRVVDALDLLREAGVRRADLMPDG